MDKQYYSLNNHVLARFQGKYPKSAWTQDSVLALLAKEYFDPKTKRLSNELFAQGQILGDFAINEIANLEHEVATYFDKWYSVSHQATVGTEG